MRTSRYLGVALVISAFVFGCNASTNEVKTYDAVTTVINLIATPEHFFNKKIEVDGVFVGFHQDRLYLSSEHAENLISSLSISVLDDTETEEGSLSFSSCSGEWVKLWATFIPAQQPGVSTEQGRLVVDRAMLHKDGKTCWKRTEKSRFVE
jgi:hypothetical protein